MIDAGWARRFPTEYDVSRRDYHLATRDEIDWLEELAAKGWLQAAQIQSVISDTVLRIRIPADPPDVSSIGREHEFYPDPPGVHVNNPPSPFAFRAHPTNASGIPFWLITAG